jgi:cysteine-rich repeat protein
MLRRSYGAALLGSVGWAISCIAVDAFECIEAAQCISAPDGLCHDNGHCSYFDPDCESERRWSNNAGALARQCVDASTTGDASGTTGVGSTTTGAMESTSEGGNTEDGSLPAVCGNGTIESPETCDDGNLADGDGCNADCQPSGRISWSDTVQVHPFDNALAAAAVRSDGIIVAAGYTSSEQAETVSDSNQYDPLIVRYDLSGRHLATWTASVPGRDQLRCVTLTPMDEFVVAGERRTMTGAELWVARVDEDDAAAQTIVSLSETVNQQTVGHDCVTTDEGAIVVAGMIDGDLGEGYEAWDRFVVYDPVGVDGWTTALPAPVVLRDLALAVTLTEDGSVIAAGSTAVAIDNASDRWAARFDAQGQPSVWEYVNGGPGQGHEEILGAVATGDVVYFVGVTAINQGNVEAEWLGALGVDDGVVRWDDDLGIDASARANSVTLDKTGALVIAGTILETDGSARAYVAKFDPAARAVQWLNDDLGAVRGSDAAVADDDSIVFVGSTVARAENGPAIIIRLAP